MDIAIGVGVAVIFSTLISFIEVMNRSKSDLKACLTGAFFIYWLILGAGNTATTLLAVSPVERWFSNSNGDVGSDATSTPEISPSSNPTPTPSSTPSEPPKLSGTIWFWYAFIGVFGFEILLKNINLTFANIGVLSINDWISKALDSAAASAIESQTSSDTQQAQKLANELKLLTDSDLNAQVLNSLGADRLKELQDTAQLNGADPRLTKALALAYEAPDKAAAILISQPNRP
jgi:hypothetical protein